MSKSDVMLRLRGIPRENWESTFRSEAHSLFQCGDIDLIDAEQGDGSALRSADPSVIAAAIEGGATVLAAVIGALLGAYLASRKAPVDGNVRVVVRSKSKAVEFVLPRGPKKEDLTAHLSGLGTTIEVSIG